MTYDARTFLSGLFATGATVVNGTPASSSDGGGPQGDVPPAHSPLPMDCSGEVDDDSNPGGNTKPLQSDQDSVLADYDVESADKGPFVSEWPALSNTDLSTDYWEHISDADREYLLGPREFPAPCPWCGGRIRHNSTCVTWTWEPELPFGKHKGKKVSAVPLDYLRWLVKNSVRLDLELRAGVERRLREAG